MRLFIAIRLSDRMTDSLVRLQENMKTAGVSGNYVRRENLHLTLAFIGEYGNPDAVADILESVVFTPFEMCLGGVGTFGNLFWAGMEENGELAALVRRIRKALSDRGIPFDRKRFVPHITLIRKADYKNGRGLPVPASPSGAMRVTGFSLMRSDRGRQGMIYTEIADFGQI